MEYEKRKYGPPGTKNRRSGEGPGVVLFPSPSPWDSLAPMSAVLSTS